MVTSNAKQHKAQVNYWICPYSKCIPSIFLGFFWTIFVFLFFFGIKNWELFVIKKINSRVNSTNFETVMGKMAKFSISQNLRERSPDVTNFIYESIIQLFF